MVLDDVVKKNSKHKTPPKGFYMFERKAENIPKIVKKKAADENLFAKEIVAKFLNMYVKPHYHFDKKKLGSFKKIKKKGVESSDIKKIVTDGIELVYITEQGVKALLEYYHQMKCIENYNKKDILKDLKEAASQL